MTGRIGVTLAFLTAIFAASTATAQTTGNPTGIWLTQAGDAKVRVSRCGGALCGNIVSLRDPIDPATKKPAVDDKNPDPARVNRPMKGLQLFGDMNPAGPNKWSGHIYNADDGKTYESNISVTGPDTLKVEGCLGALCSGENWSRVGR